MSSKTLDYLQKAADLLPTASRTHLLLKSYFLTRSAAHLTSTNAPAQQQQQQQPDAEQMQSCRKCRIPFRSQQFRLDLRAARNRSGRARRLVQRHESRAEIKGLSTAKRIVAKRCLKTTSAILKSTCRLCHSSRRTIIRHHRPIALRKTKTKAPSVAAAAAQPAAAHRPIDLASVQLVVTKKKRKPDKTAGLRIPVKSGPAADSPALAAAVPVAKIAVVRKLVPVVAISAASKHQPQQQQQQKKQLQPKNNHLNNSNKQQTQNKKKAQKAPKLSASAKKLAEDKQRNSMLLLANVLKMKDSVPKRPSGLEALLRK